MAYPVPLRKRRRKAREGFKHRPKAVRHRKMVFCAKCLVTTPHLMSRHCIFMILRVGCPRYMTFVVSIR